MFKRIKEWLAGWKPCTCTSCVEYQSAVDTQINRARELGLEAMRAWENARSAIVSEVKREQEQTGWRLARQLREMSEKPLPDPDDFPPCENGRDLERLYYHRADLDHRAVLYKNQIRRNK